MALTTEHIDAEAFARWGDMKGGPLALCRDFARAIEAEARAQALSEAYDLLFDVKGCKATRFDAQNAIRELAAPVDVQAWIELARARLEKAP